MATKYDVLRRIYSSLKNKVRGHLNKYMSLGILEKKERLVEQLKDHNESVKSELSSLITEELNFFHEISIDFLHLRGLHVSHTLNKLRRIDADLGPKLVSLVEELISLEGHVFSHSFFGGERHIIHALQDQIGSLEKGDYKEFFELYENEKRLFQNIDNKLLEIDEHIKSKLGSHVTPEMSYEFTQTEHSSPFSFRRLLTSMLIVLNLMIVALPTTAEAEQLGIKGRVENVFSKYETIYEGNYEGLNERLNKAAIERDKDGRGIFAAKKYKEGAYYVIVRSTTKTYSGSVSIRVATELGMKLFSKHFSIDEGRIRAKHHDRAFKLKKIKDRRVKTLEEAGEATYEECLIMLEIRVY